MKKEFITPLPHQQQPTASNGKVQSFVKKPLGGRGIPGDPLGRHGTRVVPRENVALDIALRYGIGVEVTAEMHGMSAWKFVKNLWWTQRGEASTGPQPRPSPSPSQTCLLSVAGLGGAKMGTMVSSGGKNQITAGRLGILW